MESNNNNTFNKTSVIIKTFCFCGYYGQPYDVIIFGRLEFSRDNAKFNEKK